MRSWPVPGHSINSPYGPRWGGMHWGADIAAPEGTPIVSPADGVVIEGRDRAQGTVGGFGSWVWIRAHDGFDLILGHVQHHSITVTTGERVTAGQRIAAVGSEGETTGPHLHLEVHPGPWKPGSQIDPEPWLKAGKDSTVTPTLVDFSAGVPSAAAIKADGHSGAVRYVSPPREPWMKGKPLTRGEADALRAEKMHIVSVWQFGKADFLRGRSGGVEDARKAVEIHKAAGGPEDAPIFFAIDQDLPLRAWNDFAAPYLRGAAEVIGKDRVGIYCKRLAGYWAIEDDVIGECRDGSGRFYLWQPNTWMGADDNGGPVPLGTVHPRACLFQRLLTPRDDVRVAGVQVDVNDALAADFGQWGYTRGAAPVNEPGPAAKPAAPTIQPNPRWRGDPVFLPELLRGWGVQVVEIEAWRERGHGDFNTIWGTVVHHTGGNGTPASYIAKHPSLGLASQIHLDRSGVVTLCGAGIAYHAGRGAWPGLPANKANAVTIGIEANSDGKSPWPPEQYEAYVRICAAICWFLGHDASRVIAHKEWGAVQGKWDPGGIDMNRFRADVQLLIDNPPFGDDTEGFLMALSEQEQKQVRDALIAKRPSLIPPAEGEQHFEADVPAYIQLIDAATFRTEATVKQLIEAQREHNELLKNLIDVLKTK